MLMYHNVSEMFSNPLSFFFWRNIIEIIFFSSLFYYLALWLRKDKQKSLTLYFYVYCLLIIASYNLQLTTIYSFLLFFAPVIIMAFILIHQKILQRNFITLKNIKPSDKRHAEWLNDLMSTCLVAINNNKEIRCIIECNDNLQDLVVTPFFLQAHINKELLSMLIESQSYDETKMLWITQQGILIGINATWKLEADFETWPDIENKRISPWHQDTLLCTSRTDALIFIITPQTRTFDIMISGKIIDRISVNNAISIIKNYITKKCAINSKGEAITYENRYKKNTVEQRTS